MASTKEYAYAAVDWCCATADGCGESCYRAAETVSLVAVTLLESLRSMCRREPLPSRPLVCVAVVLAAGCAIGPCAGISERVWWLAAAGSLAVWVWLACGRNVLLRDRFSSACGFAACDHDNLAAMTLIVSIACGGAGWSVVRYHLFGADELAWSLTESPVPIAIQGTVVESPRVLTPPSTDFLRGIALGPSSECIVAVQAVRDGSRWRGASGRAAVILDGPPPSLTAGSRVRVFGRGLRPSPALNPGEFDFRERARSLRCLSIVRSPGMECVEILSPAPLLSLTAIIDRVRTNGIAVLRKHVSPERAPLAAALLLGSRESLPSEESREFLVTGTIHILSISGLHVGILALALLKVLRILAVPHGWSLVSVALCTGLYMLLVRAETPVVRATLLVWLSCLAALVGRRSLALNALAVAAILVLLWHPPEIFRIGTQLSFVSTAVLIAAAAALPSQRASSDPIDRLIQRSRPPLHRWVRRHARQVLDVILVGAAIWAVTAPVVAAWFHVVSPIGLVLNPVVAPLVAMAMGWGFLCLAAAPFSSLLASLFGTACDTMLQCIDWIVTWAAGLPGAYAWVSGPPGWWVAGWYVLIAITLLALPSQRLKHIATWCAVAGVWIGVGLLGVAATAILFPRPLALEAVVAAMGHGCGIVVRSPTNRVLVYDAGRLGAPAAARRAMSAVLWSGGINHIDRLVLSHADTDHFNAVPELLERFSVGELVVSQAFLDSRSLAVGDVLGRVHMLRIPIRTVHAGDSIPFDALCRVRVLHPATDQPGNCERACGSSPSGSDRSASDNQTSLVLAIESAGRRLLLTGDLEGNAMAEFVAADPDTCDALIAPHHGSRTSLPPDLAKATAPDWVFVSGVGGSSWSQVRRAYEEARADRQPITVIQTGGEGAIAMRLTAEATTVWQFTAQARSSNRIDPLLGRGWRPIRQLGIRPDWPASPPLPGRQSPVYNATQPLQAAENLRLRTEKILSAHPVQSHKNAGQPPAGS